MSVMRKISLKITLMLNEQMFEILKKQFVSNLNQDLLALSGFCDEDEILEIIEKVMEMVKNKFASPVKSDDN